LINRRNTRNRGILPLIAFLFVGSLFTTSQAIAASVTIEGKADPVYQGKKIHLLQHGDYVSYRLNRLQTKTVGDDGTFSFEMNIDQTVMVMLRSDGVSGKMFVQPDGKYSVIFPKLASDQARSIANVNTVDLAFEYLSPRDVNALVASVNGCYEEFVADNYELMMRAHFGQALDSFMIDVNEHSFYQVDDSYFLNYKEYLLASLEQMDYQLSGFRDTKRVLFETYFKDRPILYENLEYMSFFHAFHEQYFAMYIARHGSKVLSYAINGNPSHTMLLDMLGKDDFLENMQLRELVLMKGLGEVFHTEKYSKDNIVAILDSMAISSEYPENRLIAGNIRTELTRLEEGFKAPEITLQDVEQTEVKLSEQKGKYVYLQFYAEWCKPCQTQMRLIPKMVEDYGKYVTFISISMDNTEQQMQEFLIEHPDYEWTFLYGGDDVLVQEQYGIRSLPGYFLISPEGTFMQAPALSPMPDGTNRSIDESFFKILKTEEPEKGQGVLERENRY
jgi:thiol-disulfide isomerase/thioredoxin